MPYVTPVVRDRNEVGLAALHVPEHAGELNYVLTRIIVQYLACRPLEYRTLNEVMGVLACIQQELYRRVIAPYEDGKLEAHGDVFHELTNRR